MKRFLAVLVTTALLWTQPAAAQSILRDAETEALFADMMSPLATGQDGTLPADGAADGPEQPPRRGWWQRTFGA